MDFNNIHNEFTITGVSVKLIFPENFAGNNPISWCMAFYENAYLTGAAVTANPNLVQTLQGSQTGPVPTNRVISRYFNLAGVKKRLGISNSEVGNFNYYGQLGVNRPYV